ncbi:uncharacterized protein HMPREF1541_05016 [Cyphellophora europaea CBS 101466]|uniref:ML-like domain-containing protein n=1 Tax=Cyphellophora europaea (strain CBS 101466) TaxID=1220924 RepID=W2RW35_CYPE1|nr:uncharacterized protein HMPREF1541_05016 [Cyphellophora europaea CBS 101466]ETN40736.1 hypothetical protein HMPREF1541_05016 [Cyphellophora europaea CBS 101466]
MAYFVTRSWFHCWTLLVSLSLLVTFVNAQAQPTVVNGHLMIPYTGDDGTQWFMDDRRPSLYTQTFGDCQGDSLLNVSRFDAAYYKDNMTVLFHLEGSSALANESVILYIGVYAYGEPRFNLTFDPCFANIHSLCPMNASVPIQANGIIPVAPADVANIPPIALSIPDFEGQAILRVFANSTQSQIGCFSAVITNGSSFSHPSAIGTVLGLFALIAMFSSAIVASFGASVTDTRQHFAHSLSVSVVFAVFHHIYFTGALSMNWPSVLVAFWSNYAWSAGMIHSESMQNSINSFIGSNSGNISMVGSAPAGQNNPGLGGGFQITQIYKRALGLTEVLSGASANLFSKRDDTEPVSQSSWYGQPVRPGLPLPGNYSGFAGTLAPHNIPASNAFLTGLLWFLILLVIVAGATVLLKWSIEALVKIKIIRTRNLDSFRNNWLKYTGIALLRTCYIAFFLMLFLALFQFTLGGSAGVIALAAVVFTLFVVGMLGTAAYALYYRLRHQRFVARSARLSLEHGPTESASSVESKPGRPRISIPFRRFQFTDVDSNLPHVHDDPDFTSRFGWLSARFRRSKWWFFAFWLVYELVRACLFGGAAGHAQTQVFGLLAWEIISLVAIVWMRPFESNRLNFLMVYFLGFSKVVTVALSSAFDPRFGLGRILTTVIGVIIIVIQGLLTIVLMIFVVLGAISSYMSVMRYRQEIRPRSWNKPRERYFEHVAFKATDKPRPPPPPPPPAPEYPKEPYFSVTAVRREPKIDENDADIQDGEANVRASTDDKGGIQAPSRAMSMRSSHSNLPYGARGPRNSWSTRDFVEHEQDHQPPPELHQRMSQEVVRDVIQRHRAASLRGPHRAGVDAAAGFAATAHRATEGRTGHRRTVSNPLQPKRNSSIVLEGDEYATPLHREA